MRRYAILVLAGMAVAAAGCTTRLAYFPIVTTKNVDMAAEHELVQRNVEGDEMRGWLLFIPLGSEPSIQEAMDEAIEEAGGDYMRNAKVDSTWWTIIVFSGGSVNVEGDVWRQGAKPASSTTIREIYRPAPTLAPAPAPAPVPEPETTPAP